MKRLNFFSIYNRTVCSLMLMVILACTNSQVFAQLKPVNASYFFNEYLLNPSMAGTEKIIKASIGYRQQLSSFDGAPQTQFLTADYGFAQKSGVALKVYSDKAGLLRETSLAVTYAYHLPLNNDDRLNFGISGTVMNNKLSLNALIGDLDDPDAMDVNQRKTYIDSDFGMSYTSEKLVVQAVFPNMFATINGNRVNETDYLLFLSAVSYKFQTNLGVVEPTVVFRGIKGFKNVVDFGANLVLKSTTANHVNVLALYHSSKSATFGLGLMFSEKYGFNASYTMATSQLNDYTVGDLEVGLAVKF